MADVDPVLYVGFFKIMYAAILLYIFTCLFVKVSIVLFYRRLGHEKKYVRAVWFLIILNILVCITMSLPAAFSCRPVAFFWDTSLDGKCIEQQKLYTVNSALNVFLDFSILLLPIPIVWKAQMPLKRRLMIIALFGLGGLYVASMTPFNSSADRRVSCSVCIASLIRVTKLFGPASAQDITWAAVDSHTWSMIEVNAGIIAGCVPTLKPLFRSCFSFLNTTNNSRPTYESDFKDGSGGGGKRSWKYNSRNIALGSAISKSSGQPSPKVLGKMYQSQLTKSDEELMMAQDQREIWRTTEVKVDIEAGSPHAKEQKEEV